MKHPDVAVSTRIESILQEILRYGAVAWRLICARIVAMREPYNFSEGEQGKFYRPDAILKIPIYLDDDLVAFLEEYAKEKKADLQTAVNDILRHNKDMLQALR